MEELERTTLTARLDAINDSQQRARTSLWVMVLAVAIILLALHNAYLAWDSEFAKEPQLPVVKKKDANQEETEDTFASREHGRNQSRSAIIKAWIDSQVISIPLLGIKVLTSDAAFLGSIILYVLSYYHCLCLRRENRDIVHLLKDTHGLAAAVRRNILFTLRAGMVFNVTTDDQPVRHATVSPTQAPDKAWFSLRTILWVFSYAPFATIILIIVSDLYVMFGSYDSPFRMPGSPGIWSVLSNWHAWQFILTDLFALVLALPTLYLAKYSREYSQVTLEELQAYEDGLSGVAAPAPPDSAGGATLEPDIRLG